VDTAGNVFIADTGNRRIVVTDTEGNYRYQWGYEGSQPGAFNEPIGVAVDENGSVYVADTWNGRVQVFSKTFEAENVNPTPSATILIPGWQINTYDDPYIAVGTGGKIYATVPTRNQVVYANTNGDVLLRWGGEGADFASLNYPSGLAVGPSGGVYVVDRGNGRTLRFAIPEIAPPVSGQ
jgi:sugar lactone lactonase YvrE